MKKTISIVGLGLIGGSFAKAIKSRTNYSVIGFDLSDSVLENAITSGAIDDRGGDAFLAETDILLISLYPAATVDFIRQNITKLKKGCIIVDTCGVKQYVCDSLIELACQNNVYFIGGHPMAGREFSGFEYALDSLFNGASMILIPNENVPKVIYSLLEELFTALGFAKIVYTSAEKHDKMIAFTSQLAHIVSSAYIKSPEALEHTGYSAGSYKDLTRVAKLNENMWTELFLMNSAPLVNEIDEIIMHLTDYRNAITNNDYERLYALLKEGRERKESIG